VGALAQATTKMEPAQLSTHLLFRKVVAGSWRFRDHASHELLRHFACPRGVEFCDSRSFATVERSSEPTAVKFLTISSRGVAQPGSAPALGEDTALPTALSSSSSSLCFQQLGESAFARAITSSQSTSRVLRQFCDSPEFLRRQHYPSKTSIAWSDGIADWIGLTLESLWGAPAVSRSTISSSAGSRARGERSGAGASGPRGRGPS
jgi:hypothetical protein